MPDENFYNFMMKPFENNRLSKIKIRIIAILLALFLFFTSSTTAQVVSSQLKLELWEVAPIIWVISIKNISII